jgi:hypothetical protein
LRAEHNHLIEELASARESASARQEDYERVRFSEGERDRLEASYRAANAEISRLTEQVNALQRGVAQAQEEREYLLASHARATREARAEWDREKEALLAQWEQETRSLVESFERRPAEPLNHGGVDRNVVEQELENSRKQWEEHFKWFESEIARLESEGQAAKTENGRLIAEHQVEMAEQAGLITALRSQREAAQRELETQGAGTGRTPVPALSEVKYEGAESSERAKSRRDNSAEREPRAAQPGIDPHFHDIVLDEWARRTGKVDKPISLSEANPAHTEGKVEQLMRELQQAKKEIESYRSLLLTLGVKDGM